jgi:hypothetical protein
VTPSAHAGFVGPYDYNLFTVTNTNADGFAFMQDGGQTLVLTGGNNGSGLAGATDFWIVMPLSGLVSFSFTYSSADAPTFDRAGFLANDAFSALGDTDGAFGTAQLSIMAGSRFGFRVATDDNTGEPGVRHSPFLSRARLPPSS